MIEIDMARLLELRAVEKIICNECKPIIRDKINIVLDEMLTRYEK